MIFTENQIINYLKEIVDVFRSKYKEKNGISLNYTILSDTSYNNENLVHFGGFIDRIEDLLLCCIEVDLNRVSGFSDKLVKFILAHELCHSLDKQLDESNELSVQSLVKVSKHLGTNVVVSVKWSTTAKDIKGQLCQLRHQQFGLVPGEHKCIDSRTKMLLNLSDDDTKQCIEELYIHSNKNEDITTRLKAAKEQDYKGCLEMI